MDIYSDNASFTLAEKFAGAAIQLVGVPFRLHGRDPATGLDCVGVAYCALHQIGRFVSLPNDYKVCGGNIANFDEWAIQAGFVAVDSDTSMRCGDIILCATAVSQHHLMVWAGNGFVHAHASLRRVVLMPAPSPWPVLAHWRMRHRG